MPEVTDVTHKISCHSRVTMYQGKIWQSRICCRKSTQGWRGSRWWRKHWCLCEWYHQGLAYCTWEDKADTGGISSRCGHSACHEVLPVWLARELPWHPEECTWILQCEIRIVSIKKNADLWQLHCGARKVMPYNTGENSWRSSRNIQVQGVCKNDRVVAGNRTGHCQHDCHMYFLPEK